MRACIANPVSQRFSGDFEFLGEVFMGAGNGLFDALGIGGDRFTLRGEAFKQGSNAAFIFRIGALQIGDFGAYDCFQFAGSSQSPLNAIAHGCDFAANGLRERDHAFGRQTFGLG